jgi:hypothetical protein
MNLPRGEKQTANHAKWSIDRTSNPPGLPGVKILINYFFVRSTQTITNKMLTRTVAAWGRARRGGWLICRRDHRHSRRGAFFRYRCVSRHRWLYQPGPTDQPEVRACAFIALDRPAACPNLFSARNRGTHQSAQTGGRRGSDQPAPAAVDLRR